MCWGVEYSGYITGFMLDLRIPKACVMKQKEQAALGVLFSTGIDILEAALVAKAALEAGRGRGKRAIKCINAQQ